MVGYKNLCVHEKICKRNDCLKIITCNFLTIPGDLHLILINLMLCWTHHCTYCPEAIVTLTFICKHPISQWLFRLQLPLGFAGIIIFDLWTSTSLSTLKGWSLFSLVDLFLRQFGFFSLKTNNNSADCSS